MKLNYEQIHVNVNKQTSFIALLDSIFDT